MPDILKTITSRKHMAVAKRKHQVPFETLKQIIYSHEAPPLRPFCNSLEYAIEQSGMAIIAELKKASPSKGVLCENYQPSILAQEYAEGGATCLSVLTEEEFFYGHDSDLIAAKANTQLPILRKDFIVDAYQIFESRVIGADCILLIAASLSEEQLFEFYEIAADLGLAILIEVANETELEMALKCDSKLIGINNRNLRDFSINLETSLRLKESIPRDKIIICESGIRGKEDIERMLMHEINAFLVGETLVKAPNPSEKLRELFGKSA